MSPKFPLVCFGFVCEPLAITLQSDPRITGISRNGLEQRVSLYADDLLLYISNFSVSVPAALAIFNPFGVISGYKLNLNKSELFPLNKAEFPLHSLPFKIARHSFTYLGVQVTDKFIGLYKANFAIIFVSVCTPFSSPELLW